MGQFMYLGGSCKGSDRGFCLIDPYVLSVVNVGTCHVLGFRDMNVVS